MQPRIAAILGSFGGFTLQAKKAHKFVWSPSAFPFACDRLCAKHDSFWWIRLWFQSLPCNLGLLQSYGFVWGSLCRLRKRMSLSGSTWGTRTSSTWSHRDGGILLVWRRSHLGLSSTERMVISCSTTLAQSLIFSCYRSFEDCSAISSPNFRRSVPRGISICL